jgi:hypothetical protein
MSEDEPDDLLLNMDELLEVNVSSEKDSGKVYIPIVSVPKPQFDIPMVENDVPDDLLLDMVEIFERVSLSPR